MSWIRLDDQIAHHPKFTAITPEACWLYVTAIGFCQKFLTDGFIAEHSIPLLSHVQNPQDCVKELLRVGLFEPRPDGIAVHDYLEFNPKAAEIRLKRQQDRARKLSERNPNGIRAESTRGHRAESARSPRARARVPSHPYRRSGGYKEHNLRIVGEWRSSSKEDRAGERTAGRSHQGISHMVSNGIQSAATRCGLFGQVAERCRACEADAACDITRALGADGANSSVGQNRRTLYR